MDDYQPNENEEKSPYPTTEAPGMHPLPCIPHSTEAPVANAHKAPHCGSRYAGNAFMVGQDGVLACICTGVDVVLCSPCTDQPYLICFSVKLFNGKHRALQRIESNQIV